jgi:hypothetical protein
LSKYFGSSHGKLMPFGRESLTLPPTRSCAETSEQGKKNLLDAIESFLEDTKQPKEPDNAHQKLRTSNQHCIFTQCHTMFFRNSRLSNKPDNASHNS